MENEIWKDIGIHKGINYSDCYQVSNLGRVRSKDRYVIYSNGKKYFYKGVIRKQNIKSGYYYVDLSINQKLKNHRVHRLVADSFIHKPVNKNIVNHIDGDKLNNNVNNLEWVTISENTKKSYDIELQKPIRGEEHNNSKLTEKEVLEIRTKYIPRKYTQQMLADEYNVSNGLIGLIINRKRWGHI